MSRSAGPAATVTSTAIPGGWRITVTGEVDIGNVEVLEEALAPLLLERRDALLVLDVARVGFMDSSSLAVLVQAAANGATIRLERPSPVVEAVVRAAGLVDILAIRE